MRKVVFCICLAVLVSGLNAKSFRISVETGQYDRENTVVCTEVSSLNDAKGVRLFEIISGEKIEHPCQINGNSICFILDGKTPKGTVRHFLLQTVKKGTDKGIMGVEDDGKSLTLVSGENKILSYVYTLTMPPKGVNEIYARSGYIHPAFTPSGFELTTIQPEDHRHHYGIWNPWTKLEYKGEEYDLWNLGDGKGTVRSREILNEYSGKVMAGFDAALDHNIKKDGNEKTIIHEIWKVRAWDSQKDGFLWDFSSELSPATEAPILIKEYRYAGFGFRANKYWTKENCEMISSEGHNRSKIDGTRGRWIYTQGDIGNGKKGGLLMMASPSNYNSPEPLRIWDENAQNVGYVFMNFAPTKNKDWNLEPGNVYRLNYRLFAFDGVMTPERAEALWTDFAFPPKINLE